MKTRSALLLSTLMSAVLSTVLAASGVAAAPAQYIIDPMHTFPSFEGDHLGGVSVWRGKLTRSSGKVMLDRVAGTGSVDVVIDADSIDFGLSEMNTHAVSTEFLDTAKFPKITYKGNLEAFVDGKPTRLAGELTLHGITRPVTLQILSFKCMPHPMSKRELCGADALGTFKRDDFGLSVGKDWGFSMDVTLRVQVEANIAP